MNTRFIPGQAFAQREQAYRINEAEQILLEAQNCPDEEKEGQGWDVGVDKPFLIAYKMCRGELVLMPF